MDKSPYLEESKRSYYGWVVVGVALLALLIAMGLVYSFGVFFKPLAEEFGWGRAATAGAFSAYAIIHNIFAPVTGRLTDRYGPRIVAITGGFCIGLSMFVMSQITAIWQIYLFYAVIFGFGVASIYVPFMATVSRWFTEKRGLAIGITAVGLGAGSLVFSPLAAWLITSYGWRMAYIVVGVICWVLFIPIVKFVRQAPKRSVEVAAESESNKDFTATEALKTRAFWVLSLSWFFIASALWGIMIHIVPLLTDMGVSLITAGTIAGLVGGVSIAGRVAGGFFSDKIGRKRCFLIGVALQLAALILLLFCQPLWTFFLFAAVLGLGLGGWGGVLPSFPADFFGSKATATILGFIVILAGIGVAIGAYAGGYIYDATGSYDYLLWTCVIASAIGLVFAGLIKAPAK